MSLRQKKILFPKSLLLPKASLRQERVISPKNVFVNDLEWLLSSLLSFLRCFSRSDVFVAKWGIFEGWRGVDLWTTWRICELTCRRDAFVAKWRIFGGWKGVGLRVKWRNDELTCRSDVYSKNPFHFIWNLHLYGSLNWQIVIYITIWTHIKICDGVTQLIFSSKTVSPSKCNSWPLVRQLDVRNRDFL